MVAFLSTFLSYLLLMVIIVFVGAVGFQVGRALRRNKNKKLAETGANPSEPNS